jgi:hypothetical protein
MPRISNIYARFASGPLKPQLAALTALRNSIAKSKMRIEGLQAQNVLESEKRGANLDIHQSRIASMKGALAATGPIHPVAQGQQTTPQQNRQQTTPQQNRQQTTPQQNRQQTTPQQNRQQKLQILITREEQKYQRLLRQDRSERSKIITQILSERTVLKTLENTEENINSQVTRRQKEIGETASKIDTVTESFTKLGNVGMSGLLTAKGAILGLVKAADPVGFRMFQAELEITAMWAGRIFIPILRDVTQAVRQVGEWFEHLSAEQRQQIRDWTRLGFKILAGMAAFAVVAKVVGGVISVLSTVVSVVRGVVVAFQLLGTAGALAWSGIVSMVQTARAAISSLYTLAAAHPFLALATAIAAVTMAAGAMRGAFSNVKGIVEDATRKIEELEALLRKYESGGRANFRDVDKLSAEDQRRLAEAGNDREKQKAVLEQMKREAEEELAQHPAEKEEQIAANVRQALEETQDVSDMSLGIFSRWTPEGKRKKAIKEKLMRNMGMSEDEAQGVADRIAGNVNLSPPRFPFSGDSKLSEDALKRAINAARLPRTAAETKKAFAETAIKQGGFDVGREKGEKPKEGKEAENKLEDDKPKLFAHRPELMGIADAWRKAQTAQQGESPEARIAMSRLKMLEQIYGALLNIDKNTKHPPGLR